MPFGVLDGQETVSPAANLGRGNCLLSFNDRQPDHAGLKFFDNLVEKVDGIFAEARSSLAESRESVATTSSAFCFHREKFLNSAKRR